MSNYSWKFQVGTAAVVAMLVGVGAAATSGVIDAGGRDTIISFILGALGGAGGAAALRNPTAS